MLIITEAQALADTLVTVACDPFNSASEFVCNYCMLDIETFFIRHSDDGHAETLGFAEHVLYAHTGPADVLSVTRDLFISTRRPR